MNYHEFGRKTKQKQHKLAPDEYSYNEKPPQDLHHNDKQNDLVHDYPMHFGILKFIIKLKLILPLISDVIPIRLTKRLSKSSLPVNSSATTYKSFRIIRACCNKY